MRDYLDDLKQNWNDAYWRADHPEVMAAVVAILTGVIGLFFAWLEINAIRKPRLPETRDV
jgi:hypothetical protein